MLSTIGFLLFPFSAIASHFLLQPLIVFPQFNLLFYFTLQRPSRGDTCCIACLGPHWYLVTPATAVGTNLELTSDPIENQTEPIGFSLGG